ncbi:hypothetical protein [Eleftheria terrae]|uniref:hypothetical protein n=1 Tax=Eleftheria terrae TaxID=1597781 RepID=UPI00263A81EC|nr:hypothetical protein [Eleftheria terrae]WKB50542.1 hypothetical protein N7L95_00040 [Eleftheria terrae]
MKSLRIVPSAPVSDDAHSQTTGGSSDAVRLPPHYQLDMGADRIVFTFDAQPAPEICALLVARGFSMSAAGRTWSCPYSRRAMWDSLVVEICLR